MELQMAGSKGLCEQIFENGYHFCSWTDNLQFNVRNYDANKKHWNVLFFIQFKVVNDFIALKSFVKSILCFDWIFFFWLQAISDFLPYFDPRSISTLNPYSKSISVL